MKADYEIEQQQRRVDDTLHQLKLWESRHRAIERAGVDGLYPTMDPHDLTKGVAAYPRWPSGLDKLDVLTGGFQGLTILGGDSGTGKSMLALASALETARQGQLVVYFDAENGEGQQAERVMRYYGATAFMSDFPKLSGKSFFWVPVMHGHDIRKVTQQVLALHTKFHQGVLLIFDSCSAIADLLRAPQEKEESIGKIARLQRWMDSVVRSSHGNVRVLALSELNAEGEIYGKRGKYISTMSVCLQHDPSESPRDDVVRVYVEKNRNGRQRFELGYFLRDWRHSRFEELQ